MSWNKLQVDVENMGFEVAFRTKNNDKGGLVPDLTPPEEHGWIFVGNYDNVAGLWIKAVAENVCNLSSSLVCKIIAEVDPFIGTAGEAAYYDDRLPIPAPPPWQITERRRVTNGTRRRVARAGRSDRAAATMADRRSRLATDRRFGGQSGTSPSV